MKIKVWMATSLLVAGLLVFAACQPTVTENTTETATATSTETSTATSTETTPTESGTSNQSLYLIAGGLILVLVASVLERFCEFGRQARPDVKPGILKTPFRWVLEALWVLLLLAGGVFLLLSPGSWIFALAAVIGFWLVLPFLITPIMRNRLLPRWDNIKSELAPKGYTEKDYWRGDWWMLDKKQKKAKLAADGSGQKPPPALRKKDYYEILGLPRGASDDDIRQAYRKLSLESHPDRNPGKEKVASQKLKEINEAFTVLSNPEKRKKYS